MKNYEVERVGAWARSRGLKLSLTFTSGVTLGKNINGSSAMHWLSTAAPWNLWGIGSGTSLRYQNLRMLKPLYKMV